MEKVLTLTRFPQISVESAWGGKVPRLTLAHENISIVYEKSFYSFTLFLRWGTNNEYRDISGFNMAEVQPNPQWKEGSEVVQYLPSKVLYPEYHSSGIFTEKTFDHSGKQHNFQYQVVKIGKVEFRLAPSQAKKLIEELEANGFVRGDEVQLYDKSCVHRCYQADVDVCACRCYGTNHAVVEAVDA